MPSRMGMACEFLPFTSVLFATCGLIANGHRNARIQTDKIKANLHGRIVNATVRAIIIDRVRLQMYCGNNQTALISESQSQGWCRC